MLQASVAFADRAAHITMKEMRRLQGLALSVFTGVALFAADTVTVEQIVAKVNGDIITRTDLERERKQQELRIRQAGANPQQMKDELARREKDMLRDKIDELLLIQRGKDLSINVDTDVSKYLGQIQVDNKIADPEKFQAWIREATGMPYEDFKLETRNGILTQRVIGQEVGSKIQIPREEILAYYEKNKTSFVRQEQVFLREILISTKDKDAAAQAAADKKAKDLVARARKGERFHELARDNSDAQSAKQGGDLGAWKKGEMAPNLESQIWDKPKNFVTDPIKIETGYLILKVEDHFKEGQAALEEVEPEIKEKLYMPLFNPKVREYLTQLRRESFLEIREGYVDSGASGDKDTGWSDPAMLKPQTVTKEEVVSQTRIKRLMFMIPVPGTKMTETGKSSSK
jgi:parvulin-like peptidyl-prolyl isomerase